MRRTPICGLALALGMLVWSSAAQAADTPDLVKFRLYFLHLANIDAAADEADAAGVPADTGSWRTYEQHAAGLTEREGAILKDVAFRCNRTLQDREAARQASSSGEAQVPGFMAIVSAAVEELQMLLGDQAFESLSRRIHGLLDRAVVEVPLAGRQEVAFSEASEDDGQPAEPNAVRPSMTVLSQTFKLPDGSFLAQCATTPGDDLTSDLYSGVTPSCILTGTGISPINIPCTTSGESGQCVARFPKGLPGTQFFANASHGARMRYTDDCPYQGGPSGLHDPLRYCDPGAALPHIIDMGEIYARGGTPVCWQGYPEVDFCLIGSSSSFPVAYINVNPRLATVYPGGQKQFTATMKAVWSTTGPGTVDAQGLYKAPASITETQTATIKACDLLVPVDCVTATVTLRPLKVEVTPDSAEVLPASSQTFNALVTPDNTGLKVEWTLIDPTDAAAITPVGTNGASALFGAPANNRISGSGLEITVKACASSTEVCGTAKAFVPKVQIHVTSSKTTVATGETVQLTASVLGSTEPRQVDWKTDPDIADDRFTVVTPDTLVVDYKASLSHLGPVNVKACLKDVLILCSEPYRLDIVDSLAIQSVSGDWSAGDLAAPFTITGRGFGSNPTVSIPGLQTKILSASDSLISGVAVIPVAKGGEKIKPVTVTAIHPSGDELIHSWIEGIEIKPASLSVLPTTVELRAGEARQFNAFCLTARGAACSSPETISWRASPGAIDGSGRYTAPASVASSTTATVTACWSGSIKCATARVTLLPAQGPGEPLTLTSTPSPLSVNPGTTITWTATASGGDPATTQYAIFRQKVGTANWIPSVTSPEWQSSNVLSWTPTFADIGIWEISFWVRDANTPPTMNGYGYAAGHGPGPVQVAPLLTLTSTPSPAVVAAGTTITWIATASGGDPATTQYAIFRLKAGTTEWIPAVTSPAWQSSNVLSWTPTPADIGAWEISFWVRDGNTPPGMNGYGYVAGHGPGPVQVTSPLAPLSVTGTGSPASVNPDTTITWTVTGSGGTGAGRQYALFRKKVGTTNWIPAVNAPEWQTGNVLSWTPAASDAGLWEIVVWFRDAATPADANGYGYGAYYVPGPVEVMAPLAVICAAGPALANPGTTLTWTAYPSGGHPPTLQYAFFRRLAGTPNWIPDVTSPAWESSNALNWTPSAADVGTWETYVWVRDGNTPADMNTYGFATGCNPGPVQIVAPIGLSGTGSPLSAAYGTTLTWTASASGGHPPTTQYALFRRLAGTPSWIPAVTSPAWQSSNVLEWTPSSSDVGTWEIYIWVRDGSTPGNMNTYGFANGYNAGPVQVN